MVRKDKVKAKASATPTGKVVVPAFIQKTYEIINTPEYDTMCRWNDAGDTIILSETETFAKEVLPKYFKHRTYSSFVRQLHMYGFRKDKDLKDATINEFKHENFKRGHPELLPKIHRNVHHANDSNTSSSSASSNILARQQMQDQREMTDNILNELAALRAKNESLSRRLGQVELDSHLMKQDNQTLFQQLQISRANQNKMTRKMQKILMFIYEVYVVRARNQRITSAASENASSAAQDFMDGGIVQGKEFRYLLDFLSIEDFTSNAAAAAATTGSTNPATGVHNDTSSSVSSNTRKRRRIMEEAGSQNFSSSPQITEILDDDDSLAVLPDNESIIVPDNESITIPDNVDITPPISEPVTATSSQANLLLNEDSSSLQDLTELSQEEADVMKNIGEFENDELLSTYDPEDFNRFLASLESKE